MILVDVKVPAIDKTYDFELDETSCVSDIPEEIAEMIAAKQHYVLEKTESVPMLFNDETGQMLSADKSLYDCGIRTGNRLLFV